MARPGVFFVFHLFRYFQGVAGAFVLVFWPKRGRVCSRPPGAGVSSQPYPRARPRNGLMKRVGGVARGSLVWTRKRSKANPGLLLEENVCLSI